MMATTDATTNVMKKISKDGSGPDAPSPPVHVAVANKDLKRLQELIQSGAPQLHPKTHETALHVAARTGSMECLRWLLSNNINSPFDKDRNGSTPCHYAAVYGQIEALKVIIILQYILIWHSLGDICLLYKEFKYHTIGII